MNHDQEILDDEQIRYLGDFKLWGRLLQFIVPQWKWVLTAVSLAFIITGASLMWPRLVQLAIDKYILNNSLPVDERMNGVTRIAFLFLGVISVGFVANFFQVIALEWAGQKIMHSLRQSLFKHVVHLNLSFFSANRVGRLVTRHTNDIRTCMRCSHRSSSLFSMKESGSSASFWSCSGWIGDFRSSLLSLFR